MKPMSIMETLVLVSIFLCAAFLGWIFLNISNIFRRISEIYQNRSKKSHFTVLYIHSILDQYQAQHTTITQPNDVINFIRFWTEMYKNASTHISPRADARVQKAIFSITKKDWRINKVINTYLDLSDSLWQSSSTPQQSFFLFLELCEATKNLPSVEHKNGIVGSYVVGYIIAKIKYNQAFIAQQIKEIREDIKKGTQLTARHIKSDLKTPTDVTKDAEKEKTILSMLAFVQLTKSLEMTLPCQVEVELKNFLSIPEVKAMEESSETEKIEYQIMEV